MKNVEHICRVWKQRMPWLILCTVHYHILSGLYEVDRSLFGRQERLLMSIHAPLLSFVVSSKTLIFSIINKQHSSTVNTTLRTRNKVFTMVEYSICYYRKHNGRSDSKIIFTPCIMYRYLRYLWLPTQCKCDLPSSVTLRRVIGSYLVMFRDSVLMYATCNGRRPCDDISLT